MDCEDLASPKEGSVESVAEHQDYLRVLNLFSAETEESLKVERKRGCQVSVQGMGLLVL
jgi:hypothetical protein